MSVTLDQLSPLLIQQYEALPKGRESHKITKNYQIEVDNEAVTVEVRLRKMQNFMPKTEIVFADLPVLRGEKGQQCISVLKVTAYVKMNPVNAKVWEACATHFENQLKIDTIVDQNKLTFDSFHINGKKYPSHNHECKTFS